MDVQTVVFIHKFLVDYFANANDPISPPGIKNQNGLESAVARKDATFEQQDAYQTVFDKAAALFHSLIGNHPFHNGNKRTALLSTLYYLSEYNYWLEHCSDDDMYEFTRRVAAHEITDNVRDEVKIIAEWLGKNSRKQTKVEKPMKRAELRHALSNFGYNLIDNGHNLKVIDKNGNEVEKVLKRGAGGHGDYDAQYIAELRKRLHLTPEYNVDSARFYGQKGIAEDLSEFMRMRVEVMKRLARV